MQNGLKRKEDKVREIKGDITALLWGNEAVDWIYRIKKEKKPIYWRQTPTHPQNQ